MTAGPSRFGQPDLPDRPPPAGLFARGYDRVGTDELIARLTARLQELTTRLYTVERENRRLRAERSAEQHAARVSEVQDSIEVLTTAQRSADAVMAEADVHREQVAAESERMRDEARRAAQAILADAHARSQEVDRREQQARLSQDELGRQTEYLRSVRDAAGTQVLRFLNGIVDHVAEEFGAADPAAAAGGPSPTAGHAAPPMRPFPALPARPGADDQPPGTGAGPSARVRREPRGYVRHLAGR